jgi:hypothetical protein
MALSNPDIVETAESPSLKKGLRNVAGVHAVNVVT